MSAENNKIKKFANDLSKSCDFVFVKKIFKEFPKSEVYLVGGMVRDLFLKRESIDYDFVVRNVRIEKLEKFLDKYGKVDLVGKRFGVLKFVSKKNKETLDIALPRTEHSINFSGNRQDFDVQSKFDLPIKDDLSRRDFTINALAVNLKTSDVIDEFDGLQDLKNKIIRTVGNPRERFKEDYSRMLRAIRFACELDFKIEEKTWIALKKMIGSINKKNDQGEFIVPREVIAKELLKTFFANPVMAFDMYDESGLFKKLMPELLKMKSCPQPKKWHTEGDVWQHTRLSLEKLNSVKLKRQFSDFNTINLIIALLMHDIGKPITLQTPEKDGTDRIRFNGHDFLGGQLAQKICERLKLSSYKSTKIDLNVSYVFWLIKNHLLAMHNQPSDMKNSTLEKYFFSEDKPSRDLLKLILADSLATIPESGQSDLTNFKKLTDRIKQLEKFRINDKSLVKSILNGREIMEVLKIKSGKKVGDAIALLREEQLSEKIKTKKQAKIFLKKIKKL